MGPKLSAPTPPPPPPPHQDGKTFRASPYYVNTKGPLPRDDEIEQNEPPMNIDSSLGGADF